MMISFVMLGLLASGLFAWYSESKKSDSARLISILSLVVIASVFIIYIINSAQDFSTLTTLIKVPWIPTFNIYFALI